MCKTYLIFSFHKNSLLIVALFINFICCYSQLSADAGRDTALCYLPINYLLGGNPAAIDGTEPYSYIWYLKNNDKGLTASDYLNDTLIANPSIINDISSLNMLTFILDVSDSNGIIDTDSITITLSNYYYTLVGYEAIIDSGDTLALSHNIKGGIHPINYFWSPNYNLSSPNISSPRAWPSVDTTYSVYAIDSIGCHSGFDFFKVQVNQIDTSLKTSAVAKPKIAMNNPINSESVVLINNIHNNYRVCIYNVNGRLLSSEDLKDTYYRIGKKIVNTGVYYIVIYSGNRIIFKNKLVRL